MIRRFGRRAFLGGAVVFPGGKLDAADLSLASLALEASSVGGEGDSALAIETNGLHPRAGVFADHDGQALALAICGCAAGVIVLTSSVLGRLDPSVLTDMMCSSWYVAGRTPVTLAVHGADTLHPPCSSTSRNSFVSGGLGAG